jgi:hypothetical protein
MQLEDRPSLELDESEFFDDEPEDMSPAGGAPPAALHSSPLAVGAADALLAGEYESDDDGIVLESECSSSGGSSEMWARARLPAFQPGNRNAQAAANRFVRDTVCLHVQMQRMTWTLSTDCTLCAPV